MLTPLIMLSVIPVRLMRHSWFHRQEFGSTTRSKTRFGIQPLVSKPNKSLYRSHGFASESLDVPGTVV